MAVLLQAHYPSSYRATCLFSGFLQLPLTSVVGAAAKISERERGGGGGGAPRGFYC